MLLFLQMYMYALIQKKRMLFFLVKCIYMLLLISCNSFIVSFYPNKNLIYIYSHKINHTY